MRQEHQLIVETYVIEAIRLLHREGYSIVYPRQVECWLDIPRSERQIRRDMARLAECGKLRRIGQRGGYAVH